MEFATLLAERGVSLVLAARNREKLDALAADLRSRLGVEIVIEAVDLALTQAALGLHQAIARRGIALDILVNMPDRACMARS